MTWFRFWLLLHIFAAIAAFGPIYALGLIASYARKDPKNAHVVTEIGHAIETKIVIPAAVVMPFLTRFSRVLEALPLLIEGLGEYFGNPRLVWLGCLIIALTLVACCVLAVVGGGLLVSCFTGNPTQLCRLIGR